MLFFKYMYLFFNDYTVRCYINPILPLYEAGVENVMCLHFGGFDFMVQIIFSDLDVIFPIIHVQLEELKPLISQICYTKSLMSMNWIISNHWNFFCVCVYFSVYFSEPSTVVIQRKKIYIFDNEYA